MASSLGCGRTGGGTTTEIAGARRPWLVVRGPSGPYSERPGREVTGSVLVRDVQGPTLVVAPIRVWSAPDTDVK
jgi:hypothetical protein